MLLAHPLASAVSGPSNASLSPTTTIATIMALRTANSRNPQGSSPPVSRANKGKGPVCRCIDDDDDDDEEENVQDGGGEGDVGSA